MDLQHHAIGISAELPLQGISHRQRHRRGPQLLSRGATLASRPLLTPMPLQQQPITVDLIPQPLTLQLRLAAAGGRTP
jgi:hypothetical protein